jgi:predicted Zn-dependent protease
MPYSFRVVNATYVNAYAFPGGSIAVTRGILLSLDNEAELAALLGHELGHVNARHTAQQMSKGMLTQMVVGGLAAVAGSQGAAYGQIASTLGMLGAGALLASYSRDNEREADALGMEYMVRGGYSSQGMVDLMEMLNDMNKRQLNAAELLFATHPMSDERYRTSVQAATARYASSRSNPIHRERYLDHTAALRRRQTAIQALQTGEKALGQKNYQEAQTHFAKALQQAPDDYAGLLLMAKCHLMQDNPAEAQRYAQAARQVYPAEAQACHISGFAGIKQKKFGAAYDAFQTYDRLLPGNPGTTFFQGYCLEGMERIPEAAEKYQRYLQAVNQGEQAEYAYRRLVQWGYLKPSS